MSFTLEKLANEPIIVSTLHPDYQVDKEIAAVNGQTAEMLAKESEPQYLVSVFNITFNFEDIVTGSNTVTRGDDPILHNHQIKENIFVTTDEILKMVAAGMSGGPFGGLRIPTFDTLEQALEYIRAKIAREKAEPRS